MSETGAERAARFECAAQIKWNSEADAVNQWDSLGWDERILLIIAEVDAPTTAGPAEIVKAFLAPPIADADAEVERVATWLEKTHRPNTRTRSIAAVLRRLSTENERMQVDALIFSKYVRDLIDAGINVPISVHAAAERAKNL